jgi:hypothetical protein
MAPEGPAAPGEPAGVPEVVVAVMATFALRLVLSCGVIRRSSFVDRHLVDRISWYVILR